MKNVYITLLAVILLSACGQQVSEPFDDSTSNWNAESVTTKIVHSNTEFALDILKKVYDNTAENQFFSPLSLSIALSMALNGAGGDTYGQIAEVLHYDTMELEEINIQNQHLVNSLINADESVEIGLANSFWILENYPIYDDYIAINEAYYSSQIFPEHIFDDDGINAINSWAAGKTNNRITELVNYSIQDAVFLLVNALYFYADWVYQFDPADNQTDLFSLDNGGYVSTEFMSNEGGDFLYLYDEGFKQ